LSANWSSHIDDSSDLEEKNPKAIGERFDHFQIFSRLGGLLSSGVPIG
jgi:hypothetical protein